MAENRIKISVKKEAVFTGHKDCVYALSPDLNRKKFYSSGSDGLIVGWDTDNSEVGKVLARVESTTYAICSIPESELIVIGQNFEGVHLINLSQQRIVKSAKISEAAIFDIKYFDGKLFIATGDGTLVVMDLAGFTTLARVKQSTTYARCIAINPQLKEIAVGYSDNFIRVFNTENYQLVAEWESHKNSVFTLCYSPDYTYLLSGSRDAHLKIWEAHEQHKLFTAIVAHMYTINHIAFNASGDFFATCSKDKSIKVWEYKTFRLVKVIDKARHAGHGTSVNRLFWDGDTQLFSCSDDRTISKWELEFEFPTIKN